MNVSIAVITYNSFFTIIDTLDSILKQDYGCENIELIISDDASTDATIEITKKWIFENGYLFFNTVLLESRTNKGVSANINQAWKAVNCKWVKSIAGDDLLRRSCISNNIEYVIKNPECKVLFSKIETFGASDGIIPKDHEIELFKKNAKEQNKYLKVASFNIAPSAFISTDALKNVGYANEKYKMIEDLPMWLKMTRQGYKLHFMNEITVGYRFGESVTISESRYLNVPFTNDLIAVYKDQILSSSDSLYVKIFMLEKVGYFYYQIMISKLFKNKKNRYTSALSKVSWFVRPMHISQRMFKAYNVTKKKKKNYSVNDKG